ncbi:MAG: response regulator [Treponema sp.]|nr:response regulator [Treponema sp.]
MKTVFVVDDNDVNLAAATKVLSNQYRTFTLPSAAAMFELLNNIMPDLILLDILMPEMDGFKAIQLLKSNERHAGIPVIFISGRNDVVTEARGFELGAIDFISKPFSEYDLLNRINTQMVNNHLINNQTETAKEA